MHLNGRLVLDCSTLLPGPFLGKLLALRGARVIKIENPLSPDGARSMGEFYSDLNECKEIVSLNFTNVNDLNQFHTLIRQADGLIEGFRPHAKKKLGFDAQTLHSINPKICIASLVGYPEDSPWRDRAGHDLNFSAVTGCLSLFHEMPALPLANLFSAYEGAISLTAAMDAVTRGASGSRVVISMAEALKNAQSGLFREYKATGTLPKPGETLFSGKFPCYRIYTAADGRRISIGAIELKFWKQICAILNLSHLIPEGYATGSRGKEVIDEIQATLSAKPWSGWARIFQAADCCVEPVLDYSEVYPHGL